MATSLPKSIIMHLHDMAKKNQKAKPILKISLFFFYFLGYPVSKLGNDTHTKKKILFNNFQLTCMRKSNVWVNDLCVQVIPNDPIIKINKNLSKKDASGIGWVEDNNR